MSRHFFDIAGMASSSVSQEDFENDFELNSRRSKIRTARARVVPPRAGDAVLSNYQKTAGEVEEVCELGSSCVILPDHENPQNKPMMRKQDKRLTSRPTHINKGKQQRDRRKLREKRRSTGVVHLPSTESTGGSTGEDEEEVGVTCPETKHNTHHNEFLDQELVEEKTVKTYTQRRNKSHSDLEADDEEFDSLNQSDSVNQSDPGNQNDSQTSPTSSKPRPPTPTGDKLLVELAQKENRRLLSLLEERDRKIVALEARLSHQQNEIAQERQRLREENAALIRAMAALASN